LKESNERRGRLLAGYYTNLTVVTGVSFKNFEILLPLTLLLRRVIILRILLLLRHVCLLVLDGLLGAGWAARARWRDCGPATTEAGSLLPDCFAKGGAIGNLSDALERTNSQAGYLLVVANFKLLPDGPSHERMRQLLGTADGGSQSGIVL
jgi:hypothetical protein